MGCKIQRVMEWNSALWLRKNKTHRKRINMVDGVGVGDAAYDVCNLLPRLPTTNSTTETWNRKDGRRAP